MLLFNQLRIFSLNSAFRAASDRDCAYQSNSTKERLDGLNMALQPFTCFSFLFLGLRISFLKTSDRRSQDEIKNDWDWETFDRR